MAAAHVRPLDPFYHFHRVRFVQELVKLGFPKTQVDWWLDNKGLCEQEIEVFERWFFDANWVNPLSFTKKA